MSSRIGTHLDRYAIDAELGQGAMGVVYRAHDLKLDRTVAIKMISLAGLEPDVEREYRQRFTLEARAAGRLSHSGIVTIFDAREEEETGTPYLVMEYIEGQSLQKLLTREHRTLPLSTALQLAQEIAEALHHAHAQGVVHRDIKPANILVDVAGHPKIADFGIAKLNRTDVTVPGQVLGSPSYMAPEQLTDEGGDARSDLFSLGVILYYMLTGHKPFQGNSTDTVCFKLVNHTPPPVSSFQLKCSPELDAIVSRAITKDPAQRYQTGLALASDLQRLRDASGFCDPKIGDWTSRRLKRDAIPRYVSGYQEPPTTEPIPADAQPKSIDDGVASVDRAIVPSTERKSSQRRQSSFSQVFLVLGLLAAALACGALWSLSRPKPKVIGGATNAPPARQPASAGDAKENHTDATLTVAKSPVPSAKLTTHRANIRVMAVKKPLPLTTTPMATVPVTATLQIDIEHQFAHAQASVWVDNVLVYTQSLQGEKKRRALVFRQVVGQQFDTIRLPVGRHEVRVRIQSATESYDQTKTIAAAFIRDEGTLQIICDKKHQDLQLTLQ
jgi:serine/threonine protein kinase